MKKTKTLNNHHIQWQPQAEEEEGVADPRVAAAAAATAMGEEYIDLAKTKLYVRAKVVKQDGTKLTAAESAKVTPINNWLHSMFSQLDVFLNDRLVSSSNNLYPYRAYLETLLNHGADALYSHLTCSLYHRDKPGEMEKIDASNPNAVYRAEYIKESKAVDMIGGLFADIFNQDRYLVNNVNMKIRLLRHAPEFCLMAAPSKTGEGPTATETMGSYRVVIEQATLFVHKVKIAPSGLLSHAAVMQNTSAKYPVRRVEMKSFSLSQGDMGASRDNIVLGQMPTRVVLALVDGAAMNGHLGKNPFNFKHHNLNYLALHVDSEQIPVTAFTPDFDNGLYVREYQAIFDALGTWKSDKGIELSRDSFKKGYAIYAFDLTPSQANGGGCCGAFNLLRQGNMKIDIKFKKPLENTVSVIMHLTYENMLEIDGARQVVYDYST